MVLWRHAPVLAIGRPGESVPPVAAVRLATDRGSHRAALPARGVDDRPYRRPALGDQAPAGKCAAAEITAVTACEYRQLEEVRTRQRMAEIPRSLSRRFPQRASRRRRHDAIYRVRGRLDAHSDPGAKLSPVAVVIYRVMAVDLRS